MTTRVLFAVAGFLGFCLSVSAQETQRPRQIGPDIFAMGQSAVMSPRSAIARMDPFTALNHSLYGFPSLALSEGGRFSFLSSLSWMTPDFLPELSAEEAPRTVSHNVAASNATTLGRDSDGKQVVEAARPFFDYATGEVGFFYGRSSGKFGREIVQGYIFGEVGNDKVHISVGASYEESNGRLPRWGR